MIKEEKIKIISRQNQNEREKLLDTIEAKNRRIEEFKKNKSQMAENKRKMHEEIAKKKEIYTAEFQKLLSRKNIDDKSIKQLKDMFPESKEIDDLIEIIKDPSKMSNNKSSMSKSQSCTSYKNNRSTYKSDNNNVSTQKEEKNTQNYITNNNKNNEETNKTKEVSESEDEDEDEYIPLTKEEVEYFTNTFFKIHSIIF